jgi:hypothetical protein
MPKDLIFGIIIFKINLLWFIFIIINKFISENIRKNTIISFVNILKTIFFPLESF